MRFGHFSTIGSEHLAQQRPCEDAAGAGILSTSQLLPAAARAQRDMGVGSSGYGVVSDGCGGVAGDTSIGSRAVVSTFLEALNAKAPSLANEKPDNFAMQFQQRLLQVVGKEPIDQYLATLLGFYATPTHLRVHIQGDGALAIRHRDGSYQVRVYNWWDSMPFYPAYKLRREMLAEFARPYRNEFIEPFTEKTYSFRRSDEGAQSVNVETRRYSFDEVYFGNNLTLYPDAENIAAFAVFTDGVEKLGEIPRAEVAAKLLEGVFTAALDCERGLAGTEDFVRLGAQRVLSAYATAGAVPRDDLAMAAVIF